MGDLHSMPLHADHGPILPLVALGCRFQHSHRVNGIQVPALPSLFEILKPAIGPSSSHTLGPMRAGQAFRRRLASFTGPQPGGRIRVTLCESLAHTGIGHLSDLAVVAGLAGYGPENLEEESIRDVYQTVASVGLIKTETNWFAFRPTDDVILDTQTPAPHPNTIRFALLDLRDQILLSAVYLSVGGGRILEGSESAGGAEAITPHPASARQILDTCRERDQSLVDYLLATEEATHGHGRNRVLEHMSQMWETMKQSIARGLRTSGVLPGALGVQRRAADMLARLDHQEDRPRVVSTRVSRASVYAIAVAEENADGGSIVTAPTCGAAGVLPATLRIMQETHYLPDHKIHEALLVAGLIGCLAVAKASIAGALVGCQGEIGVASAMAAGAACYLLGGSPEDQIDRAAETALEHYLGLTCDPVGGLVQIPCIERNAAGAVSALNAANLAMISGGRDRVSFDATLEAMHQTGLDMPSRYKETSLGGLAAIRDLDRDGVPDLL